jgi:hypothetical protein
MMMTMKGRVHQRQQSGEAWLEGIIIAPVADGINTLSLNGRAIGLEDTPIPLSITPRSSDPSETFNITISDIPAGAKIIWRRRTNDY